MRTRIAAVEDFLETRPGMIGIVLRDRQSGAVWQNKYAGSQIYMASTSKLAIATTLLGTVAGEFLRGATSLSHKVRGLVIAGVAGIAAGYAWHPWFPIGKPLWTSSYVLLTAGAACLTLALCWWLIEMRGWRMWARPFLWLGSNAILAYALSTFVGKLGAIIKVNNGTQAITTQNWIYFHWFAPLADEKNTSLIFAISYLALWTLIAWGLYRKKIFVKV